MEALRHEEARRRLIPTAEFRSVVEQETEAPLRVAYERRNRDLAAIGVAREGRAGLERPGGPRAAALHPVNGVDVFHPNSGEVRSNGPEGIACWFLDTDYNEESFFVRQAYFLGANDPYSALKTTLKAEIHEEAWATLHSDTSRPFEKPASGRVAVKVINHLGDEVMKVFRA